MFPTPLDAVLFDAGGTLLNIDFAWISRILRGRGVDLDASALRLAEAASRRAIDAHARATGSVAGTDATRREGYFGNLLREAGIASDALLKTLIGDMDQANRAANLWRVPLDQALETLAGLRARGVRTAVISNADGRVDELLRETGLRPHLELVLDSHLEGVEKPDPAIFQRALDRMGLRAERAVYVGDIYSIDVVGARAAGLSPILIDSAGAYDEVDCPRIRRLGELLDHLPRRT